MPLTLNQALALVAPHTSKDKTLPQLNYVKIENGTVAATDRYTLAIARVAQPTDPDASGKVPEYGEDPYGAPAWTLDTDSNGYLTPEDVKAKPVKIVKNVITFANGGTKPLATELPNGSDYPPIHRLVEGRTTQEPHTEISYGGLSFNAEYLVRFTVKVPTPAWPNGFQGFHWQRDRITQPTVHIDLPSVATKPVTITRGDYPESEFVGMIVPIRRAV